MKLVADANILFSLAKTGSAESSITSKYCIRLYSPDYVLEELKEHEQELSEKIGRPFDEAITELKSRVVLVRKEDYADLLDKALSMIKDPENAPYLALAMKMHAPIWSNDRHLKEQDSILVFSTKELIYLLAP